jgi:transposase
VGDALSELTRLDERINQYDKYIAQAAKDDEQAQQLMRLGGVGPTTASAIVATVGKGHDFTCGRQFCAWLGLVPGQYSSGGKQRLGRITKAGDPYLRTLLIMGGKAVLSAAKNKTDPVSCWAISVQERRGYWKAVVAIAAKNARMCWAMLQQGEAFKMPA